MVFHPVVFSCLWRLSCSGPAGDKCWAGQGGFGLAPSGALSPVERLAFPLIKMVPQGRISSCLPDNSVDGFVLFLWPYLHDADRKMGEDQLYSLPAGCLAGPGDSVLYLGDPTAVYLPGCRPGFERGIAWAGGHLAGAD